jgi:hypothetical protein
MLDAVEQVWNEPDLAAFWREGELVRNDAVGHPYQKFHQPDGVVRTPRNYMLDTPTHPKVEANPWNAENPHESGYAYVVPVYAMAMKRGGEHLVYAHAPMRPETGVRIVIPGAGSITVDVPVAGRFYIVRDGKVVKQIDQRHRPGELIFTSTSYDTRLSPGAVAVAWNMRGKADRMTWTASYEPRKEGTPVDMQLLWSGESGQSNFVIPNAPVPYTFGGWVRGYRGNDLVGEGWLTLGMASPTLLAAPGGVPYGQLGTVVDGTTRLATLSGSPVKLSPGIPTFLVLYAIGTERKSWRMDSRENNVPKDVCWGNPAPTTVRIGDWSVPIASPHWTGNAGPGYEQINLWLTDSAGSALPGVPRGNGLPVTIEHTDCQNTRHVSNRGTISIQ